MWLCRSVGSSTLSTPLVRTPSLFSSYHHHHHSLSSHNTSDTLCDHEDDVDAKLANRREQERRRSHQPSPSNSPYSTHSLPQHRASTRHQDTPCNALGPPQSPCGRIGGLNQNLASLRLVLVGLVASTGNTTSATTTEEPRGDGWFRFTLGTSWGSCSMNTAHGITHPSTPCWPLQATARSSLGSFYAEKRVWPSLECLDLAGRSQLCIRALRRFYGDLFDGYSLIPTLSFDEDIHGHLIPHLYDTPSTRSVSPDDVDVKQDPTTQVSTIRQKKTIWTRCTRDQETWWMKVRTTRSILVQYTFLPSRGEARFRVPLSYRSRRKEELGTEAAAGLRLMRLLFSFYQLYGRSLIQLL
ncbi:hypothetical protein BD410DRAFT_830455 [Rickenella mellea]|uniref:Uncharacterized protein n=1 Tax=Rickenella mellea TaxID=50990 RepID=A0A4Y7PWA2_9AGAM|nr:hypothetical protein BD410DRAFT_830455 [Rickenella mellea]